MWALQQHLVTRLNRTIFAGLLPSRSLHAPLASNIQSKKSSLHRSCLGQTTGSSHTPIFPSPSSCDLYVPPYTQTVSVWSTKLFVLTCSSCKRLWPSLYWKERALSLAQLEQKHLELPVLTSHHSWYQSLIWSTPKKSPSHFKLKCPSVPEAAF